MIKGGSTSIWTELAHRSDAGVEVTLFWAKSDDANRTVVCVRDRRRGVYTEIPADPSLALDVYREPSKYRFHDFQPDNPLRP